MAHLSELRVPTLYLVYLNYEYYCIAEPTENLADVPEDQIVETIETSDGPVASTVEHVHKIAKDVRRVCVCVCVCDWVVCVCVCVCVFDEFVRDEWVVSFHTLQ